MAAQRGNELPPLSVFVFVVRHGIAGATLKWCPVTRGQNIGEQPPNTLWLGAMEWDRRSLTSQPQSKATSGTFRTWLPTNHLHGEQPSLREEMAHFRPGARTTRSRRRPCVGHQRHAGRSQLVNGSNRRPGRSRVIVEQRQSFGMRCSP